jgi:hypothetical protein
MKLRTISSVIATEPRAGFENMHIVRHYVGGKSHVTCRRYDRENDVFVDVDPSTPGIGY